MSISVTGPVAIKAKEEGKEEVEIEPLFEELAMEGCDIKPFFDGDY